MVPGDEEGSKRSRVISELWDTSDVGGQTLERTEMDSQLSSLGHGTDGGRKG